MTPWKLLYCKKTAANLKTECKFSNTKGQPKESKIFISIFPFCVSNITWGKLIFRKDYLYTRLTQKLLNRNKISKGVEGYRTIYKNHCIVKYLQIPFLYPEGVT